MEIEYVYIFSKRSDILGNDNNEEDEDVSVMDPTQNDQEQSNTFDESSVGLGSNDESEAFATEEHITNENQGNLDASDIEDLEDVSDNENGGMCILLSDDDDESESSEGSQSEMDSDIVQSDPHVSWSEEEVQREMRRLKALSGIFSFAKVI
jgi:hypothetical protein